MNNHMSEIEIEGVIKYDLDYVESAPLDLVDLKELNAWRKVLFLVKLIGKDPERYDGFGYGNVSRRLNSKEKSQCADKYCISGTQTGHLPDLAHSQYTIVTQCDPNRNKIRATGPIKPSSEALTHGAIYQANADIQFVFHVHNPNIWENTQQLNILEIKENIQYGTPDMANELKRLASDLTTSEDHIICMKGHRDGVISYGKTAEEAGSILINYYCRALQL